MPTNDEWKKALTIWLGTAERGSPHTARAYRRAMDSFLLHINPLGPEDVGGADVAEWANALAEEGLADATIAARLAAVSAFYKFCMTTYTDSDGQPLATHNPVAMVERPKVEKYGHSRPLTIEQLQALLGVIDRSTVQGMRDYAVVLMSVYTGRRSHEIRELRVGYIQHNANGKVRYRWKGKRKARWDDLPEPVWQAIRLYWDAAGRNNPGMNEPAFVSHNGHVGPPRPLSSGWFLWMVQSYAKAVGLPGWVSVHTLRHTASALRLAAGRSVLEISRLLGHSSLRVTQIYIESLTGFEDEGWQAVEQMLSGAGQGSKQEQG